jgi:cytoplasmic tRNA 2-thiolation protein 1
MPRVKPFKYTYEKEIVFYAHYKRLVYHSTECIYSPNAYRGYVRELIKDLESQRPESIIDIIHSGERLVLRNDGKEGMKVKVQTKLNCKHCGFMTSNDVCKACLLLNKLKMMKTRKKIEYEIENEEIESKSNIKYDLKTDVINEDGESKGKDEVVVRIEI